MKFIFTPLLAIVAASFLVANPVEKAEQPPAAPATASLSVADVARLLKSGIGEDVVLEKIRKSGKTFDLSTDDLLELKQAGASSAVLKLMMSPATSSSAQTAPNPTATATPNPGGFPDELGVYVMVKGEWKAIEPEIVNMRTANMLGHAFSYGIAKAKMKGDVAGSKSKTQIYLPADILIRCPDGTAASEYQVLTMEEKNDRREFEAMSIGFANAKSGARKGIVEIKFEKIGKATYKGTLGNAKRGEYGILPPGAVTSASTASAGKIYAFTVVE